MDAEKIRNLIRAAPFREFNLVLDDGRKLVIDKPYCLGMAHDGSFIAYTGAEDNLELYRPSRVVDVEFPGENGQPQESKEN